jgi:hypothetical protein|tara:strand:- start:620 stop:847 length:228 start_codon:yes stop_codon:yes gene_type:complete
MDASMPLLLPMIYEREGEMPDISKFKSVSVSKDTHEKLLSLAQNKFEVPVSVQKIIEYMLKKELRRKNGRSNGGS